jgi:hypothetical protein
MLEFGVIIFMIRLCMINPSSCAIIEWEKFTFQDYLKSSWVQPIFWAKKKCKTNCWVCFEFSALLFKECLHMAYLLMQQMSNDY